ncbi:hypothetical protein MRX96_057905 [Rhipicephalus microplus]
MGSNKGLVSPISHGAGFVSQLTRHAAERWGGFRGRTWRASADPAIDSQLRHAAWPENYAALRTPPPQRGAPCGRGGMTVPLFLRLVLLGISGALSRTSERVRTVAGHASSKRSQGKRVGKQLCEEYGTVELGEGSAGCSREEGALRKDLPETQYPRLKVVLYWFFAPPPLHFIPSCLPRAWGVGAQRSKANKGASAASVLGRASSPAPLSRWSSFPACSVPSSRLVGESMAGMRTMLAPGPSCDVQRFMKRRTRSTPVSASSSLAR